MGHVTRHEVVQLIEKFKERLIPASMPIGSNGVLYMGINAVEHELKRTSGVPSLMSRNHARVLKHYLDLPKDPKNLNYANTAIHLLSRGLDATAAIKKARKTWEDMHDPSNPQRKAQLSAFATHVGRNEPAQVATA